MAEAQLPEAASPANIGKEIYAIYGETYTAGDRISCLARVVMEAIGDAQSCGVIDDTQKNALNRALICIDLVEGLGDEVGKIGERIELLWMRYPDAPEVPKLIAAWNAARAVYASADLAMNKYDRDHLTPAYERYKAEQEQQPISASDSFEPAAYDPIQDHFDNLVASRGHAINAMMACPAPDLSAVTHKIEVLVTDKRWDCTGFDEAMATLLDDVRRLNAPAAPTGSN